MTTDPKLFTDTYKRTVRYIRFSVTDRCNLRCLYCRSGADSFIPHKNILRYEEMEALVRLALSHGINKVRFTGGEPFVRKGFMNFLSRLRAAHPELELRLTSNATRILPYINELKELNIAAINISLDSFDPERFAAITGCDVLPTVRKSLDALLEANIPIKINAVALKTINEPDLPDFIDFARKHPVDVRFIEFMPMGKNTVLNHEHYWPAHDILHALQQYAELKQVKDLNPSAGPAKLFTIKNGLGRLGLITPLSHHFCQSCNRLRITSDGYLRTCLFDDKEYKIRDALRHPRLGINAVDNIIRRATEKKPLGTDFIQTDKSKAITKERMIRIGG